MAGVGGCVAQVLPPMLASEGGGAHRVKKKGTLIFSSATSAFRGSATTAQFACGKHALRALSQSIAKEYGKQGVHACHVRLDALLDTPAYRERYADMYASPLLTRNGIRNGRIRNRQRLRQSARCLLGLAGTRRTSWHRRTTSPRRTSRCTSSRRSAGRMRSTSGRSRRAGRADERVWVRVVHDM